MFEAMKSSRDLELWLEADAAVRAGKEFDFCRCTLPSSSAGRLLVKCFITISASVHDKEKNYIHLVALSVHGDTEGIGWHYLFLHWLRLRSFTQEHGAL
jgi:hypothetical protein